MGTYIRLLMRKIGARVWCFAKIFSLSATLFPVKDGHLNPKNIISLSIAILLAAFGVDQAYASAEPAMEVYAYSSEWLNLLYFEKKHDGFKSLVTTRAFFVSDVGDHDPLTELKATITLLGQPQTTNMNPQCAYPARYEILRRHFKLQEPVDCPQLDTWIASYQPKGLELVYTSQFIANPASVFGHAFLLVPSDKQVEALWNTFNFAAAIPSDVNPFAYAWGGLTGWYSGDYSILPYYQRRYQYNAIENRDLWRYPIKLSNTELVTLLKHFWEVVHLARFRYYFLDQNCASYILKSLAAVLPDMAETSRVSMYTHPVDVIKTLRSSHRLGEPTRMVSSFEVFRDRFDQLSAHERTIFFEIIASEREIASTDSLSVLESVVDYLSLERTKHDGELPDALLLLERKALVARAKRAPRVASEAKVKRPPHASHDSMRVSVGAGNHAGIGELNMGYRLAIHDLLEDDAGFLPDSSVEAFSGRIQASQGGNKVNLGLKDLTIVKIENYPPFYRVDPKGAWLIHLGLQKNAFVDERHLYQTFGHFAYGGATSIGGGVAFAMVSTELFSFGPQSPLYAGMEGGVLFDFDFAHVLARTNYSTDPLGGGRRPKLNGLLGVGVSIFNQHSVRLNGERECLYKQGLCWFDFGAEWRTYF